MLTRLAKSALAAGIVAGLTVALLQAVTTTPLILEAETYEGGPQAAVTGWGIEPAVLRPAPAPREPLALPIDAEHDENEWGPADGLERTFYTSVTSVGTTFGFALVLLGAMVLAGARIDARNGLIWGAAAFAATGLAPALGLSPELPGSAAAELSARQFWWFGTMLATAAGLFLALRISTPTAIAAGLALIVAPHVIGAPHPQEFTSAVPSELSGHFAAASLVIHAVAWSLTGAVAGFTWERLSAGEEPAAA